MASLQRTRVNGTTYWRIVESRRINGKPRAIPILQLGTVDALLHRLLGSPGGSVQVKTFQHGDVASLIAIARRLGLAEIIDRHVPRSDRTRDADAKHRPSVGTTIVLAACNRAIRPRSKRGWASWAATTSLSQLMPGVKTKRLTSQFFWDQMHRIPLTALPAIESELAAVMVKEMGVSLDTLFYDTTNFFTYIDSTNAHCEMPQRGHSKQKRSDLRLFGLALLVSRDGQIPLCSHVYSGNQADVTEFPPALTLIRQRLADLSVNIQDVTLVYDRGNLSEKNQGLIDSFTCGYVSALVPAHHRDLMAIPLSSFLAATQGPLKNVPVYRTTKAVWGRERTVIMYVSDMLRSGQQRGLDQHLARAQKTLTEWKERLGKPRSGMRSTVTIDRRIDRILAPQFLKRVLHIAYDAEKKGSDRLQWSVDRAAYDSLCREYFGKRILISNRDQWSSEEIIRAYRGQSQIENAFRQSKDDEHFAMRPQFHWTDQKIHVHAFICLLALMMGRLIERTARAQGRKESLSTLMDELATIRLAMLVTVSGKAGRPRAEWVLEKTPEKSLKLFRALVPNEPPFVYTQSSAASPSEITA